MNEPTPAPATASAGSDQAPQANAKTETFEWHPGRMVLSWVVSLAISVLTIMFVPRGERADWFVLSIGLALVLSIVIQVSTARREGFLARVSFTVAGSVAITFLCAFLAVFVG